MPDELSYLFKSLLQSWHNLFFQLLASLHTIQYPPLYTFSPMSPTSQSSLALSLFDIHVLHLLLPLFHSFTFPLSLDYNFLQLLVWYSSPAFLMLNSTSCLPVVFFLPILPWCYLTAQLHSLMSAPANVKRFLNLLSRVPKLGILVSSACYSQAILLINKKIIYCTRLNVCTYKQSCNARDHLTAYLSIGQLIILVNN